MQSFEEIIPKKYINDIKKAIKILKDEGCSEIFIFGSLANGEANEGSDIDIAITGLNSNRYFKVMGRLMIELENSFDLVDLDENTRFVEIIKKEGLLKVA